MIRKLGIVGLGVGFLLISPPLRAAVSSGVEFTLLQVIFYSPYSYLMIGLALLSTVAISLNGTRP
jgi:hypothetical protein